MEISGGFDETMQFQVFDTCMHTYIHTNNHDGEDA